MEIYIKSLEGVKKYIRQNPNLPNDYLFISINNYTHWNGQYEEHPPFTDDQLDGNNVLTLWFDDITPKENLDNHYCLFDENDVKVIIDFLNKNVVKETKGIVVHCTAGISRSGAVGSVLNDYYNRFLEDNEKQWEDNQLHNYENCISPNPHVASLLKKALGMSYNS